MLLTSTGVRAAAPLRASASPVGAFARPRSSVAAPAVDPGAAPASAPEEWASAKPYHSIPGPEPLPLLGNLPRFLPNIGRYGMKDLLEMQMKLREDYGDIVRVSRLGYRNDIVWLFDPTLAEKAYRKEGKWPMRLGIGTIEYYRSVERKDKYDGAQGVLTTQGKDWGDFRSRVNQPLMQRKSSSQYFIPVNDVAEDFIVRMRHLRDGKKELPADFINELYKWALESITMVSLDTRIGCLAPTLAADSEPQKMIDSVQVMLEGLYKLDMKPSLWRIISTPMWRKLVASMDFFAFVADKYIAEALKNKKHVEGREPSILEKLMKEDPRIASVMSTDLLLGGVDTTSHFSAGLLFHLATNPDIQEKLAEEVCRLLPNKDSPVTEEVSNEMTYLKACMKESLRILPIAPGNSRTTQSDIVLGGYQIPTGTDLMLAHTVMSRDERHFPRPLAFEPERWLRGPSRHSAHPFVSQPFGFGPRMCIGRRFAEMEVLTLVSKIIRNFKVEYHYGNKIQFETKILNSVTSPLKFRLIDRD